MLELAVVMESLQWGGSGQDGCGSGGDIGSKSDDGSGKYCQLSDWDYDVVIKSQNKNGRVIYF